MKYLRLLIFLPILGQSKLIHTGFDTGSVVQDYVNYAYTISSGDMDFVLTLQGECGSRDPVCKAKGKEKSYGFCQMNIRRQSKTVYDSRFKDPYRQLDQCWYKYRTGTPMYAYNKRLSYSNLFIHVANQTKRTSDNITFGDRIRTYISRGMDDFIKKRPRVTISNLQIHRNRQQTGDSQ